MAFLRVRDRTRPGDISKDVPLGPHAGIVERLPLRVMRLSLDEAIVYAARRGHEIKGIR